MTDIADLNVNLEGDATSFESMLSDALSSLGAATSQIMQNISTVEQAQRAFLSEAAQLTQKYTSEQEKFNETLSRYKAMRDTGAISEETYLEASNDLYNSLSHNIAAQQQYNQLVSEAQSVIKSVATEEEQFAQSVARLDEMMAAGLLSFEQYTAKIDQLNSGLSENIAIQQQHNQLAAEAQSVIRAVATEEENYLAAVQRLDAMHDAGLLTVEQYAAGFQQLREGLSSSRKAQEEMNRVENEARSVLDSFRTPQEVYSQKLAVLTDLLAAGRLSADEYNRVLAEMQTQMPQITMTQQQWNEALQRGRQMTESLATPLERYQAELAEAQRLMDSGAITAETYQRRLQEIQHEYQQGVRSGDAYSRMLREQGEQLSRVGKSMSLYVTAPVTGIFAGAVKEFADFDKAMASAQSIMGRFDKQTESLISGSAQELAVEYGKSTAEVVTGYQNLASAGMDVQQSLATLPTFMKLATAGEMSLDDATTQLMGSLNSLGLFTDDANQLATNLDMVANAIATTANVATGDIDDFTAAVSNGAGAAAQAMGQSVDSMMAVLAAYASKNIVGNKAGTQFNILTREIQKSVMEQRDVWEKYGIEPIDKVTGKYKDVVEIIQGLSGAFSSMEGPAQKAAMAEFGFASEASKALLPILQSADAIADYKDKIASGTGAMDEMKDLIGGSFSESIKRTWSQIKNAALAIGRQLTPYVLRLNEIVGVAAKCWNSFDEGTKSAIVRIMASAAAIGPLLYTAGKLIAVLPGLKAMVLALGTAFKMTGLSAGVLMIKITALVAVADLLLYAVTGFSVIGKAIEVTTGFVEGLAKSMTKANEAASGIPDPTKEVQAGMKESISLTEEFANKMKFEGVADAAESVFDQALSEAKEFIKKLKDEVKYFGMDENEKQITQFKENAEKEFSLRMNFDTMKEGFRETYKLAGELHDRMELFKEEQEIFDFKKAADENAKEMEKYASAYDKATERVKEWEKTRKHALANTANAGNIELAGEAAKQIRLWQAMADGYEQNMIRIQKHKDTVIQPFLNMQKQMDELDKKQNSFSIVEEAMYQLKDMQFAFDTSAETFSDDVDRAVAQYDAVIAELQKKTAEYSQQMDATGVIAKNENLINDYKAAIAVQEAKKDLTEEEEKARKKEIADYQELIKLRQAENAEIRAPLEAAKDMVDMLKNQKSGLTSWRDATAEMQLEHAAKKQAEINQEGEKYLAQLKDQAAVMGMNNREAELYKLAQKGISEEMQQQIRAQIEIVKAGEARMKGDEFLKKLRTEVAVMKMLPEEAGLYKLQMEGVSEAVLAQARGLQGTLKAWKEQKKLVEDAKALNKKHAPAMFLKEEEDRLREMLKTGEIGLTVFGKAIAELREQAEKEIKVKVSMSGVDAIAADSAQFMAELMAMRQNAQKGVQGVGFQDMLLAGQGALNKMMPGFNENPLGTVVDTAKNMLSQGVSQIMPWLFAQKNAQPEAAEVTSGEMKAQENPVAGRLDRQREKDEKYQNAMLTLVGKIAGEEVMLVKPAGIH